MRKKHIRKWLLCGFALASGMMCAQNRSSEVPVAEVRLHIVSPQPGKHRTIPAVIWLEPLAGTPTLPFLPHGHYTLLQKNRTFIPHLQIIPVGTVVQFPNKDPFFHNIFSLFDGKRFDLGLYEAGSSRTVHFDRPGVSFLFCNIHPEMSAVVVAVPTRYYGVSDRGGRVTIANVPHGRYRMEVWAERSLPEDLNALERPVVISVSDRSLPEIKVAETVSRAPDHKNKFGQDYV